LLGAFIASLRVDVFEFGKSSGIQEMALYELQRQQFINLGRVIPVAFEVALHHFLNFLGIQARARQRLWIEQHFSHVFSEPIAIPDTKVVELLSPEKKTLEMKR
jgi:hypothetical protein